MKTSDRRQRGRSGLELVEEAIHLLRTAPGTALTAYYAGSLPFILALLWFWADMSRNPFAARHVTGAALGLALLFLWLKFWQAVFANTLRACLAGDAPPRWNWRRARRIFIVQAALQPSAALILPLAFVAAALPLPWAYAFYQNVTALNHDDAGEVRTVFKRAWKQAFLWPGQNHLLLCLFLVFGGCVFLNLASFCLFLPQMFKMLLGIESVYTQSPLALLNTTFFAAMFGLTYLCLDPVIKTVYLLRCFYGESVQSGADLKAELKAFAPAPRLASVALVLLLGVAVAAPLQARDTPPPATAPVLSVPQLDQTINDVIHQQKYTWRLPREKIAADDSQEGFLARFFDGVAETLKGWLKGFFRWLGKVFDWFLDWLGRWLKPLHNSGDGEGGLHWIDALQGLFFVLVVLVVCGLVFFLFRVWRNWPRPAPPVASEAILPAPDLTDENVDATQLPEDAWIQLGRELLGRGELRLALRAFYFASLAQLSARHLIAIAKFKSNRDYERELSRRGHALPDLLALFGDNVSVFDRSWYGLHDVNPELVRDFITRVERIKATG